MIRHTIALGAAFAVGLLTATGLLSLRTTILPTRVISESSRMKQEQKAIDRQAWPDAQREAQPVPHLDYYVYPRTFQSSVSVREGLAAAVSHRDAQIQALSLRKALFSNTWSCGGPFNAAGRMRIVRYHPSDPSIMYAGAAAGGVWKTTNSGASWFPLTDMLPTLAVGHLAIDPRNPETVYVGTGEGSNNYDAVYGNGLYKTTDGGRSWRNILTSIPNGDQCINQVELHPLGADTIFCAVSFGGSSGGVFKTTDGGGSWKNVLPGPARSVIVDRSNPRRVIAGMGYYNGTSLNGIFVSESNGDRFTFTKVTDNLPAPDSSGRIVLDQSISHPGTIFAAIVFAARRAPTSAGSSYPGDMDFMGLYKSTTGGTSWTRLPASDNASFKTFMRAQGDYNLFVRVHPTNPDIIFMGGIETWRSTNGGQSFTKISKQGDNLANAWVDMHSADFDPIDPKTLVVTGDGGVYRTRDCLANSVVWNELATNLATYQFYGIDFDRQNTSRVVGGTQDRRNNIGVVGNPNWTLLSWSGDGGYTAFDHKVPSTFYVESQYGNIARTDNNGGTFTRITNGLERTSGTSEYMSFIAPFLMHPTNNNVLFIAGNKVYRTNGKGAQWVAISDDLTKGTSWTRQFQDLSICTKNPDVLWGVTGSTGKAFRTTNSMAVDAVWTDVSGTDINQRLPALFLASVAVHPTNGDIAYVGTSSFDVKSGVYRTSDGGVTWKYMTGATPQTSLPKGPVGALVVYDKDPRIVFAGTDVGVYVSMDEGENWIPFGDGLPTVVIDDLKITPDGILYAGTHGRGLWMTSAILTRTDALAPIVDQGYALGTQYPNPASSTLTVPFTVAESGTVEIALYDASGHRVMIATRDNWTRGSHTTTVSVRTLRPGTYFLRMTAGSFSATRKVLIIR